MTVYVYTFTHMYRCMYGHNRITHRCPHFRLYL